MLLRLAAAACLGAFYAYVAGLVIHPDPSAEYRAHYFQRSADCWLEPTLAAEPAERDVFDAADLPQAGLCRFLRLNWFKVGPGSVGTRAMPATLRLPWRATDRVELTLRGPANSEGATRTVISGDGIAEPVVLLPNQTAEIHVALAPHPMGEAWLVQLSSSYVVPLPTKRGGRVDLVRIRYVPKS